MITPSNRSTENNSSQEVTATKQLTYEEQLAQHIAEQHQADVKRFGVPLWALRNPGPAIDIEDDQWIDEGGATNG